ncbi:MAG: beta-ketoacyl-ACP synthase II [Eubacteriales bacterium]|nr:beta-ketoacyl-ACP synthase II [Eubacteriales bacterium]
MRRVVITGMGVVSPVGNDIATFFDNLIHGVSGIGLINRFDTADFKVKIAAEVKDFDVLSCYESNSEAKKFDRFTHYAMGAAAQAMADSGLCEAAINHKRLGVYVGSGIGGMDSFVNETYKLRDRGPSRVSPFFIPMMISNMASGSIAIRYNARGPTLTSVTACATSTNAIGEAYRAIKHDYADMIIAGGTESAVHPLAVAGFMNSRALSEEQDPAKASIPLDLRRNGFVIGEGAGILILEEYEHAVNRGSVIYAEVCGYGNTCDAFHITAPDPDATGSSEAIILAKNEARITGDEKIYINAHGTSTPLNDKTETTAMKKAFGDSAYKLAVSSTKSMTGHMLGAAGAVEAIASVMALKNGIIPPTIGYSVPDPECDLDYVPNKARRSAIEYALSTSLGFGGHNACVAFKKIER